MKNPLICLRAILIAIGCIIPFRAAEAHDPYQGWATAWLRPKGIEIQVILSMSTARKTLDDTAGKGVMSPDNFEELRPQLEQRARTFYEVAAGETVLLPTAVRVVMTDEYDISYRVDYPPAEKGPVVFRATYLEAWENGYGTTFAILDERNRQLAYDDLFTDRSEIRLEKWPIADSAASGPALPAIPSAAPQAARGMATAPQAAPQIAPNPSPREPKPAQRPAGSSALFGAVSLIVCGALVAAAAVVFVASRRRPSSRE